MKTGKGKAHHPFNRESENYKSTIRHGYFVYGEASLLLQLLALPATHGAGSVVDLQPPQFSTESEERHYMKNNAQKAFLEEHLPLDL